MYSSSRPRNKGGDVIVLSAPAFTTDTEADGGVDGNALMMLPLYSSVGSAAVVSGLLKSHTTSLMGPLLSSCYGRSSLQVCRPGSCASQFPPYPLDQQLPVLPSLLAPPLPSLPPSVRVAFHSCHFVHSNPAHLSNHVNSSPIVFITARLSSPRLLPNGLDNGIAVYQSATGNIVMLHAEGSQVEFGGEIVFDIRIRR